MTKPPALSFTHYRRPTLTWTSYLIPGSILVLAIILAVAYWQHPRQEDAAGFGGAQQLAEQQDQPWWQRLLDSGREDPQEQSAGKGQDKWTRWWEDQKRRNVRVRSRRASAPPGAEKRNRQDENKQGQQRGGPRTIADVVNDDHLALRQLVLAEAIINYREGRNPGAENRIRRSASSGPYRVQEEKRYLMETLWAEYHDHTASSAQLQQLADVTEDMASSSFASFEDQANAGLALMLAGRVDEAIPRLNKALEQWPAENDRVRGDLYLFLTCAYGIKGNDAQFIPMLLKFKENYQDWLYVETYLPHLRHLKNTFPKTPVIDVVHGHVMTLVHNDREAARNYDAALANPALRGRLRQNVTFWRRALIERSSGVPDQ